MRTIFGAAQDGLVRNKPIVASAAQVPAFGMPPTSDVGFVRIRHTQPEPVDRCLAALREVKYELVAIINIARGLQRLEMPRGYLFTSLSFHRNRLDPVERILEDKEL